MSQQPNARRFRLRLCHAASSTVARPNSSDKTLLDARNGSLRMAWSFDDLLRFPPLAFVTPTTTWEMHLTPELDGHPFPRSSWTRSEGFLPMLDNLYVDGRGTIRLEVAGCDSAAVARITLTNTGERTHRFGLRCDRGGGWSGYNPAWADPDSPADALLAGWQDRADRVLVLGLGADRYYRAPINRGPHGLAGSAGRDADGLVDPAIPGLRGGLACVTHTRLVRRTGCRRAEWHALLGQASQVIIPDPGVRNGYYAGLADLFIMREPVAGGYIAGEPGTEGYRAPNSYEAGIMAVALDQAGLHDEAELGYRLPLDAAGTGRRLVRAQGLGASDVGRVGLQMLDGHGALPADRRPQLPGPAIPAHGRQLALAGAPTPAHPRPGSWQPAADVWADAARHGRLRPEGRRRPVRRLHPA